MFFFFVLYFVDYFSFFSFGSLYFLSTFDLSFHYLEDLLQNVSIILVGCMSLIFLFFCVVFIVLFVIVLCLVPSVDCVFIVLFVIVLCLVPSVDCVFGLSCID